MHSLRDLHADAFHNRSVFTLINDPEPLVGDVRALIGAAFKTLDLRAHEGVHPRFGVVDVVPFVALEPDTPSRAIELRDDTAQWISDTFDVPVFLYGPVDGAVRTLPDVRQHAFDGPRAGLRSAEPVARNSAPSRWARGRSSWRGTSG